MRVLILDGHPDEDRLTSHLLDHYAASLDNAATIERVALRGLSFDPNLRRGYRQEQAWEPDLDRLAAALLACDHLVVGFPLWWGSEPALLKGLVDRLLLPGFAFRYRRDNPFWDRLLAGRSADVIILMDTPPWYLALAYGNPVVRRWRGQVLGFCGFKPLRFFTFGPTRQGGAASKLPRWLKRVSRAAATAQALRRTPKSGGVPDRANFARALEERQS